jgi:hypothetical protein
LVAPNDLSTSAVAAALIFQLAQMVAHGESPSTTCRIPPSPKPIPDQSGKNDLDWRGELAHHFNARRGGPPRVEAQLNGQNNNRRRRADCTRMAMGELGNILITD